MFDLSGKTALITGATGDIGQAIATALHAQGASVALSGTRTAVLEELRGKTIILGVLDLSDHTVETPETVAARIRRALPHVDADKVIVAPDCGLKYLPTVVAFGKMKAMVEGARIVRAELG